MWRSPNATIRHRLDGTIFHQPITFNNVPRLISHWKQPIIIARHCHGDHSDATDVYTSQPGILNMQFLPEDGSFGWESNIHKFEGPGVFMAMYNTDESINHFAHTCFQYALTHRLPVKLATKEQMVRNYDARFKEIFQEVFESDYYDDFQGNFLTYEHRNIDDMTG